MCNGCRLLIMKTAMMFFCVLCNVHYLSQQENEHNYGLIICGGSLMFIILTSIVSLFQREKDVCGVLTYIKLLVTRKR
jgi:hypothetical protein